MGIGFQRVWVLAKEVACVKLMDEIRRNIVFYKKMSTKKKKPCFFFPQPHTKRMFKYRKKKPGLSISCHTQQTKFYF